MEDFLDSHTPVQELDLPELVEIEPIHSCNFRCIMCHVSYEQLTKQKLDVPTLLPQLKVLKGRWVMLSSSYESTVHADFVPLVTGLTDIGCKIDITSNGSVFTGKLVDQIRDVNFRFVTISFDGIRKETFESFRRNADFERTVERILRFREAFRGRNTYFNVNQTLMRRNIGEIVESVDFWEKADALRSQSPRIVQVYGDRRSGAVRDGPPRHRPLSTTLRVLWMFLRRRSR